MSSDVKPGYKQTEIGVIPEDWSVCELGDLAPYVTSGSRGWAEYYSDRGDPFIRITNLSRSTIYIDQADLKFVQIPDSDSEGQRTALLDGDLLISITADIGIIGYVDSSLSKPAYINQHIALVRFKDQGVDSKYLSYFLAGEVTQRLFRSSTDQGAKAGMNLTGIRSIKAVLPPIAEQQAISAALSEMDKLLSNLDQLIAKKRNIQQATMQQLLTGQRRLPGFSGEWEAKRLGDHLSFLKNGTNSRAELSTEGDVHYLHYGDIHGSQHLLLNPAKSSMPCLPRDKAKRLDRLENGDVIFADASEDLDGVGKSVEVQLPEGMELVSGLHTIAVRFDKKVISDGFKAYLQFIPTFRSHLRQLAAGTKVYATSRAHIASAEVEIPEIEEQTAIASILSEMDTELAALETRRDKARQIKQGMMQELLTGRIRLA